MPIYEYRCDDCGRIFEKLVLGSSDTDVRCPKCDCREVKRLLSSCSSATGGLGSSSSSSGSSCGSSRGFS
ncbi:MAG: zinc ribbon domain-containing protein [Thermodesulfobacteriota bacterium]